MPPWTASDVVICVGLTRDEAERMQPPAVTPHQLVLCVREVPGASTAELPPRWSSVHCAAELPILSHSADLVLLSARLLPDSVLLAEARRVLSPFGTVLVMPRVWQEWESAQQAQVTAELESVGMAVETNPAAEWHQSFVILARVPRGRPS